MASIGGNYPVYGNRANGNQYGGDQRVDKADQTQQPGPLDNVPSTVPKEPNEEQIPENTDLINPPEPADNTDLIGSPKLESGVNLKKFDFSNVSAPPNPEAEAKRLGEVAKPLERKPGESDSDYKARFDGEVQKTQTKADDFLKSAGIDPAQYKGPQASANAPEAPAAPPAQPAPAAEPNPFLVPGTAERLAPFAKPGGQ